MKKLISDQIEKKVDVWIEEDLPGFDYSAYVVGDSDGEALLYCKSSGILAGVPFFEKIFTKLNCKVEWFFAEGTRFEAVKEKVAIASVKGKISDILLGERISLNIISHCSGVATKAAQFSAKKEEANWGGKIAATRKTTPGLRQVEKYGVLVGGCDTHRMDLSSCIMIKDNHIKALKSVDLAIKKAKEVISFTNKIECESKTLEEALQAAQSGADIIMLDNRSNADETKKEAAILKAKYPHVLIEISGGMKLETISEYFDKNIDIISVGELTYNIHSVDYSLKII